MVRPSENWERLVRAPLRREKPWHDGRGGHERAPSGVAGSVPPSLTQETNIDLILQAAEVIQSADPNVARIRHKKTSAKELHISSENPKKRQKTEPQKQCTFRSNLIGTVGLLANINLNNAHVDLLKQTPFWLLIDAIRKGKLGERACMKHDKPILTIIQQYDSNDSKFLIGGKKVALTRNDIKLIFGIACGSKPIGELNKKKTDVSFATRRGIQEPRLGSKKIKDLINQILLQDEESTTDEDNRDVVRMICMFICLTLFFSTSGVTLAWTYVDSMENIEEIKDYDWAQSIADTLNASLHKFHAKPRDATGCVPALMFWLCEHTNLLPRPTNSSIPRLINWNTSHLQPAVDLVGDLSNASIEVYENDLQETSEEAQVYSMTQPEVVDDDNEMMLTMMHHTESPPTLSIEDLIDIPLFVTDETSPIMLTSSHSEQPQEGAFQLPSMEEDIQQKLQQLEEENQKLEKDKDSMKTELEEIAQERDALKLKTAVLEKARDALKIQLLEVEQHRDSLQYELQNMDTMSIVLKQERDELEKQLLAMGKERETEKQQLQHHLSSIEQSQKAILVQKDEEIRSLTNKLSLASKLSLQQQHTAEDMPAIQTASSSSSLEQNVLSETAEPEPPIMKKPDFKIHPLDKKADKVLALLPPDCQQTIRQFWELEEGSTPIWGDGLDQLYIYEEDVRFLLCDQEITGQPIDAYARMLTTTLQPPTSPKDRPFVFTSYSTLTLGGTYAEACRVLDLVPLKLKKSRIILIPIHGEGHFTLLELDTLAEEWRFYNSIRSQGRKDRYCDSTSKLRNNVTVYINKLLNKKIKTSAQILDNTPQQEPGSVDCGVVVAYIVQQKLLGKPVQSNITKQQCLQLRADIVQSFITDPQRSWTPQMYYDRMETVRLQKLFNEQDRLEEENKKA